MCERVHSHRSAVQACTEMLPEAGCSVTFRYFPPLLFLGDRCMPD